MIKLRQFAAFLILFAAVGIFLSAGLALADICQDECLSKYERRCVNEIGYQVCGYYDNDNCLEWSTTYYCPWGQVCGDEARCAADVCEDECLRKGYRKCSDDGKGYHVCGYYDDDNCLEWSLAYYCQDNKTCQAGECGFDCADECAYAGQSYCLNESTAKVCGKYDSDACLDWTTQTCSGSTACGYGRCQNTQRPYWHCFNGKCDYECQYESSCEANYTFNDYLACYNNDVYWFSYQGIRGSKYQECGDSSCSGGVCIEDAFYQCSSGVCCDNNSQTYKSSSVICSTQTEIQYACPWGLACGSDVGKRQRTTTQYCSGANSSCNGRVSYGSWSGWEKVDECASNEQCVFGNPFCQKTTICNPSSPSSSSQNSNSSSNGGASDAEKKDSAKTTNVCTVENLCEKVDKLALALDAENVDLAQKDKDNNDGDKAGLISFASFTSALTNWFLWCMVSVAAISWIIIKQLNFADWLAKRKLKKLAITPKQ